MDKIVAVPTNDGETISGHFGRAKYFKLYTLKNNSIDSTNLLDTPGHQPGAYPKHLADNDVDCVLVSGMGRKAIELFEKNNIEVIMGHSGKIKDKIEKIIEDEISSQGSACEHGRH